MNERVERSPFKVGVEVAVVSHHWNRRIDRRSKVVKVYKNGNFIIQDSTGHGSQWRPNYDGRTADRTGDGRWSSTHLEVWTAEIEQEIAEGRRQVDLKRRRQALVEAISKLDPRESSSEELISKVEALLAP